MKYSYLIVFFFNKIGTRGVPSNKSQTWKRIGEMGYPITLSFL